MLSGCGLFKKSHPDVVPPANQVVNITKEALEYCPLLNEERPNSFEQALVLNSEITIAYVACANKQTTSIKLLKKLGNIK